MGAFEKIGSSPLTGKINIAISRRGDGKYSLAKYIVVDDDGEKMDMFWRGAFTLAGDELIEVRNLINKLFNDDGTEKEIEKKSKKS